MRAARFDVAASLIAEALHLPAGSVIVGASVADPGHAITLTVDHPDLPEAEQPHDALPVVTREPPAFDWGIAS